MENMSKEVRKQKWKEAVEAWIVSGLSVRQWCLQQKISGSTFHYWKKIFAPQTCIQPSLGFTELASEKKGRIELECAGVRVSIESDFDEILLTRCLQVLKRM